MADLGDIRAALAANLSSIPGLNESPYLLGNPTPPAAEVQPADIDYHQAMGNGVERWTLIVRVFVGTMSDKGAQIRLDRLLASSGSESVKAAIESDTSLAGAVDDVTVTRCTGYRIFNREGMPSVLGAEWTVSVLAIG
jgi:hypothetical protein